jgi:hypothetical protein
MNKRAIEVFGQVVRVLEGVKDSEFKMGVWLCGSVGCVLGHCSLDSWFNEQGFYFDGGRGRTSRPAFKGFEDMDVTDAFQKLLGTEVSTNSIFSYLFFRSGYSYYIQPTREVVLERLNMVLAVLKDEGIDSSIPTWVVKNLIQLRDCNDENT